MARNPGSLCRFKCACGTVEAVRGGSKWFRCSTCRLQPRLHARLWTGREEAGAAVAAAKRLGQLPHPSTLRCADCAGPAEEYEHRDYNKPLVVDPICRRCNLRRGPAIPLHGSIRLVVARGYAPYALRRSAERVLAALGRDPARIAHLPKRLEVEQWREIVPLFEPDPRSEDASGQLEAA